MKWKHIMEEQPEHDESIIQIDKPYLGHYSMGMRNYHQLVSFENILKNCEANDWPRPDFWWVRASEFPFPEKRNKD